MFKLASVAAVLPNICRRSNVCMTEYLIAARCDHPLD